MKRHYVDPLGNNVERQKRVREETIQVGEKSQAIEYAIRLTMQVCDDKKIDKMYCEEVIPSTAIYNIAYRIHQYMRGYVNSSTSNRMKSIQLHTQEYYVKGTKYEYTHGQMLDTWKKVVKIMKIDERDFKEFIARTHTVVCLMQLFHERIKELQIGPDSWVQTKKDNDLYQYSIQKFGIPASYRHFMSGISWDVNLRSTLSKFTSGLCQLGLLSLYDPNTSALYVEKNKIAAERAYSFIPQFQVVADFIKKNDAITNSTLLSKMAHITALHGDRHKRRMSIPFCVIYKHCVDTTQGMETDSGEKGYVLSKLDEIGFSSKKGALLYNLHCQTLQMPGNIDRSAAAQLFFHAYFGTSGEDFGVLSTITDQREWKKRNEIPSEIFKGLKPTNALTQAIRGIKLKVYSKSITATQNKLLSSSSSVYGSLETFSGYRQKSFDDSFIDFVRGGGLETGTVIAGNLNSIVRHLDSIIDKLCDKIQELKRSESTKFGTSDWHSVDSATFEKGENGLKSNLVPVESGICFWND
uniref:NP n=1 Tax=Mason Creek virus TaxID=2651593 RepID=A0A5P8HZL3_9VIRU|nr:NP [Mason Creek virus]